MLPTRRPWTRNSGMMDLFIPRQCMRLKSDDFWTKEINQCDPRIAISRLWWMRLAHMDAEEEGVEPDAPKSHPSPMNPVSNSIRRIRKYGSFQFFTGSQLGFVSSERRLTFANAPMGLADLIGIHRDPLSLMCSWLSTRRACRGMQRPLRGSMPSLYSVDSLCDESRSIIGNIHCLTRMTVGSLTGSFQASL